MTLTTSVGTACACRWFATLRKRYSSRSSQQITRKSWRRNDAATISPHGSRRVLRDAIAARRLRSVKRSVRSTIKLGVIPVLPPFGETNRNRDRNGGGGAVDQEFAALRGPARAFCDPRRFGSISARHHDDEFLSTQTADEVAAPNGVSQLSAKALEHAIADVVTISVVHALEMVDVENHHGQRRASRARGFDHRRQPALERAAIVEPGERIVKRHLYRLLHGLTQSIRVKLLPDVVLPP